MEEKEIGTVTHFFSNIGVGVIELTADFKKGQKVHVKGASTDFEQVIDSMQIDRKDIEEAKAGDEIGVKFSDKVRAGDKVYLVE